MFGSFTERLRESKDAFKAVFTNRGLRRLQLAWAATITAYWAFLVALAVYAFDQGGATAVGIVGLIRLLPAIVAAPFAGTLGDRYPRDRVLFLVSCGRTMFMALTAAALFVDAGVIVVYVLTAFVALGSSITRPIQSALLPQLARTPEELTASNLVLTTIESSGIFLGPALGGILLAATNVETVFSAAAVSFLLATALLTRLRPEEDTAPARARRGFFTDFADGFRAIAADGSLRLIIGLYGAQTLVAGALNVLIVVTALDLLDLGESGVGFLNSAVGVGGLLGALAAFALVGRQRLAADFGLGLALWGLPIALLGVLANPPAALVLLAVVGVGNTVVDVAAVTLLQRTVPDDVLSRVFGVVQSVFVGTLGLGAILAPALVALIGIRGALIATGILLPALATLLWRQIGALDLKGTAPITEIELLRRIPLFAPLPAAAIDSLAATLEPVHAGAGDTIMREGDSGDRCYVVASGELDVTAQGRQIASVGPGDIIGEIALLRDVPRTATVTAKGDVELYALDRDEFLSAVTGHPQSAEAADAVIANRLAGMRLAVESV